MYSLPYDKEITDGDSIPSFDTPDSEASPPPTDWCRSRCCGDLRNPGWFSIQEEVKTLDIPASFGPTSVLARSVKIAFTGLAIGTLIESWYQQRDHASFYLAYLTHWGLIFTCIYLVTSLINSTILPLPQPALPSDSVSNRTKFTWILFEVTAIFTFIVTLLYWTLVYDADTEDITFTNIICHFGCFVMVWTEGLLINRVPVRIKHIPVPMFLASCYCCWLAIHQMATDIGVPGEPEDLIYDAVDFKEETVFSTILVLVVVFIGVPLVHCLLWGLSLVSCPPLSCSGKNRRYLSIESESKSNADKAPEPTESSHDHALDSRV